MSGRPYSVLLLYVLLCTLRAADRVDTLFAQGIEQQQAGDPASAIPFYESAVRLAPGRVDILSNLGLAYSQSGRREDAIRTYKKALAITPDNLTVSWNLALSLFQAGQFPAAAQTLVNVVERQPGNLQARYLLGVTSLKSGDVKRGVVELETVVQHDPSNTPAAFTLASAYLAAGNLEACGRLVHNVVLRENTADAHFLAGSYFLAASEYQQAFEQLQAAHRMQPSFPGLPAKLAYLYQASGNSGAAEELLRTAIAENPDDFESLSLLASIQQQAGNLAEAIGYASRAVALRPEDPRSNHLMAQMIVTREPQRAARLLEAAVRTQPDFIAAHVLLARCYGRLQRTQEALREQQIIAQLNAAAQQRMQRGQSPGRYDGLTGPSQRP